MYSSLSVANPTSSRSSRRAATRRSSWSRPTTTRWRPAISRAWRAPEAGSPAFPPLQSELPAKRLELLKELLPKAKRIAVLADSGTGGQLEITQATAKRLGVALKVHEFNRAPYDYEGAFAEFVQAKADAVLALASGLFVPARRL